MVRTKLDRVPGKVSSGKSSAKMGKMTPVKTTSSAGNKGKSYSGGNRAHPRDTPDWQKPITCFIKQTSQEENNDSQPSTSEFQEDKAVEEDKEEPE